MSAAFAIISAITVGAAVAAVGLRNLVHCSLALTVAFAGLAAAYLQLGAQFVGFAQVLVYVGAVAILIVFAILLTRGSESAGQPILSAGWGTGVAVALAVLGVLVYSLAKSRVLAREIPPEPAAQVRQIGDALMTRFVLPLEVAGLLLTAALIGAVLIAMHEERAPKAEEGLKRGLSERPAADGSRSEHGVSP